MSYFLQLATGLGLLLGALPAFAQETTIDNELAARRVKLPNGWQLSPAGRSLPLGDLPLNLALSPSGRYLAATNNGQSVQSIQLIDPKAEKVLHSVVVPKSWYGLAFSPDEKFLYASGGNDNWILKYAVGPDLLNLVDSIPLGKKWPEKISPAGLTVHPKRNELYVVTKDNNSLYVIDLAGKSIKKILPLGAEAYTCVLSADRKFLYISLWGGAQLLEYDVNKQVISRRLAIGNHPNELLLTKDGNRLFVANANDNSVAVVDLKSWTVSEVLNAALYPDAPEGSATNGLALSEDQHTLYVANADNNCLAVFDVEHPGRSHSLGFIPVGWYPTNIKVLGKKLFVSNGKGFTSYANPYGPSPVRKTEAVVYQQGDPSKKQEVQYIGGLMKGTLSIIDMPDAATLARYSKAVYTNTPYSKEGELVATGELGNPIPMKVGDPSPIKHVFYIIKENRTYDQVLADMPGGNGDTSLLLFGERITPNQHQLAREFVLLDNFYVDGEVSADGHNWSLSAGATDYLEKNWPTSYGGRGGTYDAEGTRSIANPTKGFIWDYCKRAGVSYRTYGEFADDYKANIPVLEGHFCPYYTSWDESVRDTTRFYQWKREFDSLLAANAVPQFNSLRFINDHTEGQRLGRPTPFAHVADNDLAVGMFVEYLSKSPIWEKSVVFIVEDDAQNGPDHVDAHRTTAYVAGGYVKRGFIDHTMYSTSSMLRTIELILGLPPMSQYDAAATPMWRCFNKTPDNTVFSSLPANVDLNEKNVANTPSAHLSESFDLSKEDAIPDLVFSEVIWKAVKGEQSVMPAPRRSAFLLVSEKDEEEGEKEEGEKSSKKHRNHKGSDK
ncbi:beta-propeller fold lactonase family protein [Flavihumibacter rivuli]|uniref:bifunctional YncE family protein/alkaline phosphatase family protein n=1 Tax=Flavihumibacter rivuli TaxID=2838156 RepID=UPI001BDE5399|nr:beta-propeller fold lactonase family protein [Flavihumibacter rivuli]ULQ55918.1 beta-propeller fold lactonase family protein [Flavihumibacter rivuli]